MPGHTYNNNNPICIAPGGFTDPEVQIYGLADYHYKNNFTKICKNSSQCISKFTENSSTQKSLILTVNAL